MVVLLSSSRTEHALTWIDYTGGLVGKRIPAESMHLPFKDFYVVVRTTWDIGIIGFVGGP